MPPICDVTVVRLNSVHDFVFPHNCSSKCIVKIVIHVDFELATCCRKRNETRFDHLWLEVKIVIADYGTAWLEMVHHFFCWTVLVILYLTNALLTWIRTILTCCQQISNHVNYRMTFSLSHTHVWIQISKFKFERYLSGSLFNPAIIPHLGLSRGGIVQLLFQLMYWYIYVYFICWYFNLMNTPTLVSG